METPCSGSARFSTVTSRELGHDHGSEQPFTRSQSGLAIPDGIDAVTVVGHDLENRVGLSDDRETLTSRSRGP